MTLLLRCFEIDVGVEPRWDDAQTKLDGMDDRLLVETAAKVETIDPALDATGIRLRLRAASADVRDAWRGKFDDCAYSTTLTRSDLLAMGGDDSDVEAMEAYDSADLFHAFGLAEAAGFRTFA